jgi:hypothetical protein
MRAAPTSGEEPSGSASPAEALKLVGYTLPRRVVPVMTAVFAHHDWSLRVAVIDSPLVPAGEAMGLHRSSFLVYKSNPARRHGRTKHALCLA